MMRIVILVVVAFVSINTSLRAQLPEARAVEKSVQLAIEKAEPAIVGVVVSRAASPPSIQEMAAPTYAAEYFGSGVMIDHRLVLTCYHVVRDATAIGVRIAPAKNAENDRATLVPATIYAADSRTDLAVLRLDDPRVETPSLEIGKVEALKKGSFVIALSQSPSGQNSGAVVSSGIVSDLHFRSPGNPLESERIQKRKHYGKLVQIDARIRPGASGGALLDLEGKLVGILTTQFALSGDMTGDYAVLCDAGLLRVIDVLRKGNEVEYGFLGVAGAEYDGRRKRPGVILSRVTDNSPAALAGLNSGDMVLKVDDQPVSGFDDMVVHIGLCLAGREAVLDVIRPGRTSPEKVRVKLGKAYHNDVGVATNRPTPVYGLRVDYATVLSNQNNQFAWLSIPKGVVVRDVIKGSPAEAAGLHEGMDVIRAVNGVSTPDPASFYREAKKEMDAGRPIRLELTNRDDVVTLK